MWLTFTLILEEREANGDTPEAISDGTERESFDALNRGSHNSQLKLDLSEAATTSLRPQHYQQLSGLDYYPMTGKKHGVCLVINNMKFAKDSYRKGSARDEHNLVQTWLYLGYRVEVRRNCTLQQFQDIFKDIDGFLRSLNESAKEDKKVDNDSFVCCILSHGEKHAIVSSDSQKINIEDIERMIGKSCILRSKPKLFFVQSCRGPFTGSEIESDQARASNRGDIHISYATSLGDKAYRDTTKGSWFVTELCKILCEHAPCCTLDQMQHKLNAEVPTNVQYTWTEAGKDYTEQPATSSSMTKYVHFFDSAPPPTDSAPQVTCHEV